MSDVAYDGGLRVLAGDRVKVKKDHQAYLLAPVASGDAASDPGPALAPLREELRSWVTVVAATGDACLLVDTAGVLVGLSLSAARLLGCDVAADVGRGLAGDVMEPLDFGAAAEPLPNAAAQLPSLSAVASDVLARGLVRLRRGADVITVDVVAAPLHGRDGGVIGSLSFLAVIADS